MADDPLGLEVAQLATDRLALEGPEIGSVEGQVVADTLVRHVERQGERLLQGRLLGSALEPPFVP